MPVEELLTGMAPAQDPVEEEVDKVDPDHPLLARAQAALKSQLEDEKYKVDVELLEKQKLLKDAKKRRCVGSQHATSVGKDARLTERKRPRPLCLGRILLHPGGPY